MDPEVLAAVNAVRSVIETSPYDGVEAERALGHLAVLVPPDLAPMVHKVGPVIAKSIEHPGSGYDSVARYALKELVTAIDRSFFRIVK